MKITKEQLKRIIKEELASVMTESRRPDLETYKRAMNMADLKKQPGMTSVAQGDELSQALDPDEYEAKEKAIRAKKIAKLEKQHMDLRMVPPHRAQFDIWGEMKKIEKELAMLRADGQEIKEIRMDTVAGHVPSGNPIPAENEMPQDLKDILGGKFANLETEYDDKLGWVVYFETGDNTHWSHEPPPGWEVEQLDDGAYDGDEQYIMYRAVEGHQNETY